VTFCGLLFVEHIVGGIGATRRVFLLRDLGTWGRDYPREVWRDPTGVEMIESFTIPNMSHGAPIAVGKADGHCGTAGAFVFDVGISSSYHIANFWDLRADG
jgi:poly(3-hydroxybutyrate) depolymerase